MEDFLDFGADTESDPASALADASAASPPLLRRIVVAAADDRPESRDALALAAALAGLAGSELVLASVGAELTTRAIASGAPAADIKEIAAIEEADLIVLGSSHRGPIGRALPGSVGERVMDGAPCAVAIAPRGYAGTEPSFQRLVVGYDGSREAAAALDLAAGIAAHTGARLELLGVVEMKFDLAGFPKPPEVDEVERVRRILGRAEAGIPPAVRATTKQVHGGAAETIAAAAHGADLLLVGSRGHYGPARRLVLGSVAARLARQAPCATLVVPAR